MKIKAKIIIFGKNGQIGSNLVKLLKEESNFDIKAYASNDVDFSNLTQLSSFLENLSFYPDFIINAAAYTAVDKAEEEQELADLINHQAVKILADYSKKNNVKLIHYSTDYVFDGLGNEPFTEDNTQNLYPINIYGKTKLLAEKAIINSKAKYIILRISWIYDQEGKNFMNIIAKLAQEREVLTVISDQIGSPTSASFVASSTIKIIKQLLEYQDEFPAGIYHLASNKYMSWYSFAIDIINTLKNDKVNLKVKKIIPIKTCEYKTLAQRPLNSRLNCQKIFNFFKL
jgi:dTDP-4-dehydrorhamnose reductase